MTVLVPAPSGSSGATCSSPVASPRSRGGPSTPCRASAATECPVPDGEVACLSDRLAEETGRAADRAAARRACPCPGCTGRGGGGGPPATGAGAGRPAPAVPGSARASASWRELKWRRAARAQAAVCWHADFPVEELRTELGLPRPPFEAVVDVLGESGELPPGAVLGVAVPAGRRRAGAGLLDHRTDASTLGLRPPDRRLPPDRAVPSSPPIPTPDFSPGSGCSRPMSWPSSSTGWPARTPSCPTPGCTSSSSDRVREHPDAVAAVHRAPAADLRRAERTAPTGWPAPCWPAACSARRSSRSSPSGTWTG